MFQLTDARLGIVTMHLELQLFDITSLLHAADVVRRL